MWFKKRKEQQAKEQQAKELQIAELKFFKEVSNSLTLLEKRMSSIEIELDALKTRFRKKLVEPEKETKDINTDVILPM